MALTEYQGTPPTADNKLGLLNTIRLGVGLMGDEPLEGIENIVDAHGRQLEINVLGKSAVLIANGTDARTVLVDEADSTSKDTRDMDVFRGVFGNFILTRPDSQDWRPFRAVAQPGFDRDHTSIYTGIVREEAESYAAHLAEQAEGGSVVVDDLHADLTEVTARIISRALFSHNLSAEEVIQLREAMRVSLSAASEGVQTAGLSWRLRALTPSRNREIEAAKARLQGFAQDLIDRRVSAGVKGDYHDMLDMFLAAHQSDPENFDDGWLRDEVAGFFGAGHDTTASAVLFTLSNVSGLHDEALEEQLHIEAVDPSNVGGPQMTTAVFKETLRRNPPIWLFGRRAIEPIELRNGHIIPRNATIGISPYLIHRDPDVWEDPTRFDPMRFTNGFRPQSGSYIPFGMGARSCVGASLAAVEGPMILSDLYKQFPHIEVAAITTSPAAIQRPNNPLRAQFYLR